MKLTANGIIRHENCNIMRTADGMWRVSRARIVIGFVHSLAEVPALIEGRKELVRQRLAELEAEAERKTAEREELARFAEFITTQGEGE